MKSIIESTQNRDALRELVPAIVNWGERSGRMFPWRSSSDCYELAVAEILLQKTKGADAERVWANVMDQFPCADLLAKVDRDEIVRIIEPLGLGNQRAIRLQLLAQALTNGTPLEELPSLGSYGKAIVAMSCKIEPTTVPVDGNIARVICRVMGFEFDRGEPRKKADVRATVQELLSFARTAEEMLKLTYSLVDIGATLCSPRSPSCFACPFVGHCVFAASNE